MNKRYIINENLSELIIKIKVTNDLIGNPIDLKNIVNESIKLESFHEEICILKEILKVIKNMPTTDNKEKPLIKYLEEILTKEENKEIIRINNLNNKIENTIMIPKAYYELIEKNNYEKTYNNIIKKAEELGYKSNSTKSIKENAKEIIINYSIKVNSPTSKYAVINGYEYDDYGTRIVKTKKVSNIVEAGLHNIKREILLKFRKSFNEINIISNNNSITDSKKAILILEIIKDILNTLSYESTEILNVYSTTYNDLLSLINNLIQDNTRLKNSEKEKKLILKRSK